MNLISPKIFSKQVNFEAVFTTANRNVLNTSGKIPGLNLGNNTNAGAAEIQNNYRYLFNELGWDQNNTARAVQVHGDNVKWVDQAGTYSNCDGLITNEPGLALTIQVADCAAVLVANLDRKIIGAFHAGWKGAAKGIISKGLLQMKIIGNPSDRYIAYLSPCISAKNFEVGEEVAELFPENVVDRKNFIKPHVDLKEFIKQELVSGGIKESNIEIADECTFENPELYSYRNEREMAGRMLAMIKINQS